MTANADTVNEWVRTKLAGGALARNTEAYNQVMGALPALIASLDAFAAAAKPKSSKALAAAAQAEAAAAAALTAAEQPDAS